MGASHLLLLFVCYFSSSEAKVDFSHATVYDIRDFIGVGEVAIPRCDNGCRIYAATQGEQFVQYPDKLDPYARKLILQAAGSTDKINIAELALQKTAAGQKLPASFQGPSKISVINTNDPANDKNANDIVLYVVDKITADAMSVLDVYDVYYARDAPFTPQSDTVTILSAVPFTVSAPADPRPNTVTARLVGYDNLRSAADGCPDAFVTPTSPSFPGLHLPVNVPILSLAMQYKGRVQLSVTLDTIFDPAIKLGSSGFVASEGWNGCKNAQNGGIQSYQRMIPMNSDVIFFNGVSGYFSVRLDISPNLDDKHKLTIQDMSTLHSQTVSGTTLQTRTFARTSAIQIIYATMRGDQGFLINYSSSSLDEPTSPTPEVPITATRLSVTSTTTVPPTTSSSWMTKNSAFVIVTVAFLLS